MARIRKQASAKCGRCSPTSRRCVRDAGEFRGFRVVEPRACSPGTRLTNWSDGIAKNHNGLGGSVDRPQLKTKGCRSKRRGDDSPIEAADVKRLPSLGITLVMELQSQDFVGAQPPDVVAVVAQPELRSVQG